MTTSIRTATGADVALLARLDEQGFGEHAYSTGTIRQLLEVFPRLGLLAESEDGGALGHIFGGLGAGSETGWVLALATISGHQRRGVGRALGPGTAKLSGCGRNPRASRGGGQELVATVKCN